MPKSPSISTTRMATLPELRGDPDPGLLGPAVAMSMLHPGGNAIQKKYAKIGIDHLPRLLGAFR